VTDAFEPPDLGPEPGWIVHPPPDERPSRSFVSGDPHGTRIRVRYFYDPVADARVGKAWFGPHAEGPPGHAHGGAVAAVLDEALGTNVWIHGLHVLAGTLQVVYRRPTPLLVVTRIRTRIDGVDGRKVRASGALVDADGVPYAEASGVFVQMRAELEAALNVHALRTGSRTPDGYG
jgi:acyl-coenzyme A thioesterase PaaI-like protein